MNRAPGKRGIHKHLLSEAAQFSIIVHERRYRDAHDETPLITPRRVRGVDSETSA